MSSALKLEPRCPEPARFTATSAFSAAHVGEQREARVGVAVRGADAIDAVLRDERELRHAGRR